jgi:hypothetical protein
VEDACVRIPVERSLIGPDGLVIDDAARSQIAAALGALAAHAATAREA